MGWPLKLKRILNEIIRISEGVEIVDGIVIIVSDNNFPTSETYLIHTNKNAKHNLWEADSQLSAIHGSGLITAMATSINVKYESGVLKEQGNLEEAKHLVALTSELNHLNGLEKLSMYSYGARYGGDKCIALRLPALSHDGADTVIKEMKTAIRKVYNRL